MAHYNPIIGAEYKQDSEAFAKLVVELFKTKETSQEIKDLVHGAGRHFDRIKNNLDEAESKIKQYKDFFKLLDSFLPQNLGMNAKFG